MMRLPTWGTLQDPAPESTRARRVQNGLALAFILTYIALAWICRDPTDVGGADELEYRALGQAIERGTYREIYQPDQPYAVKYPPLVPLWQVALRAVTGDHLDGVVLANILLTAVAIALVFLIVRTFAGGWLATGVVAVLSVNEPLIEFTGSMLSEPMYILTTTIALCAAYLAQHGRTRMAATAIAFALLAFLTRTAGITMVATIGIWLMLGRQWRMTAIAAAASAVIVGGWFAYTTSVREEIATSYIRDLGDARKPPVQKAQTAPSPEATTAAPAAKSLPGAGVVKRIGGKAAELATRTLTVALGVPTAEGTVIDNVVWLVALVVFLPLGLILAWRAWPAMVLYVLIYGALLVAWPYSNARILCVVMPFIFTAYLMGARAFARMLPGRFPAIAMCGLLGMMVVGALKTTLERFHVMWRCEQSGRAAKVCYDTRDYAFIQANEHIVANMEPGDIIVSSKAPGAFYLTGLQAIPTRAMLLAESDMVDALRARNVRFVILSNYFYGEDGELAKRLVSQCNQLQVARADLPESLLLTVRLPGDTSNEACEAITRFRRSLRAATAE